MEFCGLDCPLPAASSVLSELLYGSNGFELNVWQWQCNLNHLISNLVYKAVDIAHEYQMKQPLDAAFKCPLPAITQELINSSYWYQEVQTLRLEF